MASSAAAASSKLFSVVGKNVLITGSSRGIGLMIAKGFVEHGANVLLTSRSEDACKEASEAIKCQHYVSSNVSTRVGCEELAKHTAKVFDNKLHILINNAGTSWGEPLDRNSSTKSNWGFDKVFDLVRICTFVSVVVSTKDDSLFSFFLYCTVLYCTFALVFFDCYFCDDAIS